MSQKSPGGRPRRPDREGIGPSSKYEAQKVKQNGRQSESGRAASSATGSGNGSGSNTRTFSKPSENARPSQDRPASHRSGSGTDVSNKTSESRESGVSSRSGSGRGGAGGRRAADDRSNIRGKVESTPNQGQGQIQIAVPPTGHPGATSNQRPTGGHVTERGRAVYHSHGRGQGAHNLRRGGEYFATHGSRPDKSEVMQHPTGILSRENLHIEIKARGPDTKPFSDDSRLSRMMRRLSREDDKERRLQLIRQLKDFFILPENTKSIIKIVDSILVALQDVFYERTFREVKQEVAHCMGVFGSMMGNDAQRYFQWLFEKLSSTQIEEAKILFLTALLETLRADEKKQSLRDFIPLVMNHVQGVLENADTPDLLVAVLDVILHLSKAYPHVFSSHFRDTVDILVGWHIDASQSNVLTTKTSDTLIAFHNFWIADMNFSTTLLGQFLEDMEAYSEDLSLITSGHPPHDEDIPLPEDCIAKIYSLLRVFTTVIQSLGDYLTPGHSPQISWEYISDMVARISRTILNTEKTVYSLNVYTAGNLCLSSLAGHLQQHSTVVCESLLPFVLNQINVEITKSDDYWTSLCSLIHKLVDHINTHLPTDFLSKLLGAGSVFHKLKFSRTTQVVNDLLKVHTAIMSLKSVPLLEEAYNYILGDLEVALNILLEKSGAPTCSITQGNPLAGHLTYAPEEAEATAVFDICVIAVVGNSKSNLIGMWALSPSVFDLLTKHILQLPIELAEQYPTIQYAALQTVCSHCTKHGHFISSSALINKTSTLEGSVLANTYTSGHFTTILQLLTQLLMNRRTPFDSLCLAVKWVGDIIETLQHNVHMFGYDEFLAIFDALIILGHKQDFELAFKSCKCLKAVLKKSTDLPLVQLARVRSLCLVRISCNDVTVGEEYTKLLKMLPICTTATSQCSSQSKQRKSHLDKKGVVTPWTLNQGRRHHMTRLPLGTFHSHNFKTLMGYLLCNLQAKFSEETGWLLSIFQNCQRVAERDAEKEDKTVKLETGNDCEMFFWLTWEAAQFCVLTKLRTPLGKPQDTFTTIEAALKKYACDALNKDNEDGNMATEEMQDGCYGLQLRVNLLIQFMDHLEKLLYNAYEGCAVAMASAPKTVRPFFRTNRATCLEWLSRIRVSVMITSLHCHQPAMAVRQASEMLRDLKENNNISGHDFERAVMYLVQALVLLKSPEAIQGVYAWCKEMVGQKLTWIKAAVEKASGRYEQAANDFQTSLKNYLTPDTLLDEKETSKSPTDSPLHSPRNSVNPEVLRKQFKQMDPDPCLATYLVNEVTDSYLRLDDLESVHSWQESLHSYRKEYTGSSLQVAFNANVDMNYLRALSKFDCGDYSGARESLMLVPGASLNDVHKHASSLHLCWDPRSVLEACDKRFTAAQIATAEGKEAVDTITKCLSTSLRLVEDTLLASSLEGGQLLPSDLLVHMQSLACLKDCLTGDKEFLLSILGDLQLDPQLHDVGTINRVLKFLTFITETRDKLPGAKNCDFASSLKRLRLAMVRLVRKQKNFDLAERLLIKEMQANTTAKNGLVNEPLLKALNNLQDSQSSLGHLELLKIEREASKLLLAVSQPGDAQEMMSKSAVHFASTEPKPYEAYLVGDLNARSLLTLVKWLQADHKALSMYVSQYKMIGRGDESSVGQMARNLKALMDLEAAGAERRQGIILDDDDVEVLSIGDNPILSDSDKIVGRLLHFSTMQNQDMAKAWFALANWCYKWGRKAVDNASLGSVELMKQERSAILSILPKGTSADETENVLTILSQIHTGSTSEEDISDQDQSLYDDGTETTRKQLLSGCLTLQIAADGCVDRLLDVWKGVVKRVYHYYQLSAKAYFTYLKQNGEVWNGKTNMDGNITATLRLLRLLVKHAWELRGVLEDGLAHTPTTPWKGIIPQLFSRLSHPEAYVRQSVSDLLCRVAQDAPHLIVYPAVVGCSTCKMDCRDTERDGILNNLICQTPQEDGLDAEQDEAGSQEGDAADDESRDILQNCFTAMVDTLSHHNPQMISEVQLLVQELRRITLLWDELWLGTLNQYHSDVQRRFNQLDGEVKKVMQNQSLAKEEKQAIIHEKHVTVLKPTLYTLERLKAITSQPADTSHEQWFQDTFGSLIDEAVSKLKDPPNANNPQSSWQLFKQLHSTLQQRSQKRSSLMLQMDAISTKLASLKNTVIAMPGLGSVGHVVTIDAVYNTVQILPTKTKPKKLIFIGSDGKKYPYLFKGLEDLHLDERIMQFLSIVNNMFARNCVDDKHLYHARHYSVTPLGSRSGLIQWVEGATPLFGLYKRWQQREALVQAMKLQQQSGSEVTNVPSNPTAIARPSEIFYNKLTPALKEKGVLNLDSRKDWPHSVVRRVLEELMVDTPNDLLAKELWCSSTSASDWWQITQTYCRSTAVMSMIGYIIGLGDRHLDNVLVDLTTGEVVHIDYNVCFEKGKNLRVPEKVPFRMTQNIETALGITGVEGTFRLSCEHVIKTMRKGRETLLTLLEAFVYDPLVDWTTGNEGGYAGAFYGGWQTTGDNWPSKKQMDREITLSMFAIRTAEMKAAWLTNRDEMTDSIPKLLDMLEGSLRTQFEYASTKDKFSHLQEMLQLLEEARRNKEHPLYELHERYSEYAVVKTTKMAVQEAIQEKINECDTWNQLLQYAFSVVKGQCLQIMRNEVSKPLANSVASYSPAIPFLQGAGQGQVIQQCDEVHGELTAVLCQRRQVICSCLDILLTYATIVSQFPQGFTETSRSTTIQNSLQELICNFDREKCQELVSDYQDAYSGLSVTQQHIENILNTEARLQTVIGDTSNKLMKVMERRNLEGADTSYLGVQVQECANAIHQLLADYGPAGKASLAGVIITALCALTKRYLVMEGAAAAAGDRLMDLTSRDGDWFLEELHSMSGNNIQLIALLKLTSPNDNNIEMTSQAFQAMQATHQVYMALQDLNANFRNVILPESIKAIQGDEESVIATLNALDAIIHSPNMTLEGVVSQLEMLLRNAIMGMEYSNGEVLSHVKRMRQSFNELLQSSNMETSELTPGQMLLMVFNGLFTQLDNDFTDMLEMIDSVKVPDIWRKVDMVREAKGLQISAFNGSTLSLLSDIFFVKRLMAMQEFFLNCRQMALTLHSKQGGPVFDDDQLAKPIKRFIAEFVRKQVIGLPSQTLGYLICQKVASLGINVTAEIELKDIGAECKVSLDDLCKKAVDLSLRQNHFEHMHLTQAGTLTSNYDAAWRKQDLAKRLDNNMNMYEGSGQRTQLQLARYQWLHEDIFSQVGRPLNQLVMPNRASVMSELGKGVQSLISQEAALVAIQERYIQLESGIEQRLKWAAGANPTLAPVLQHFEQAIADRKRLLELEGKNSSDVISICNAILHFELLRTRTSDAAAMDAMFLDLMNRCEESCVLSEECRSSVTEAEEYLMELKPLKPGEKVSEQWLGAALDLVNKEVVAGQGKVNKVKTGVDQAREGVRSQVTLIRNILTTHHKLMSDIRTILKSMAKVEEQEYGVDSQAGGVREYMNLYKLFSETFTAMLKLAMSDEMNQEMLDDVRRMVEKLNAQITSIYDELIYLAPPLLPETAEAVEDQKPSFAAALLRRPPDRESTPKKGPQLLKPDVAATPPSPYSRPAVSTAKKPEKVTRDPKTGKAIQERNSYAVGVWRKVKMKLDGRDPDVNKKLSPAEQVDNVIKDATNLDNLALLYEGWTPWV
ncbi:serine/threonine-protein kinase SMG1-like isoform X2 [Lineus longissimus]|uniref:serine/threonine-protein kinase SMG1-like isoform X2 n=1 Tax=Lineus longissimus TaxID=88925 RepID=UPI00315D8B9F